MILLIFLTFTFLLFEAQPIVAATIPPCGDWDTYKDEKCIKVIDETHTFEDAIKACHLLDNDSSLLSIRSPEEQAFMANLLYNTRHVIDTVWLGAKFEKPRFKWIDNQGDLRFSNWASGSPSNNADKACVQMIPDKGATQGKWADEPCGKKNLVVCQRLQVWSFSRMQQTLIDARKELRENLEEQRSKSTNVENQLKQQLEAENKALTATKNDLQAKIDVLQKNPVPLNFIYVQLSKQPEPKTLWPTVNWKDVTAEYAGNFFRAEGSGSAPFGQAQPESSPRLTEVQAFSNANEKLFVQHLAVAPAAWSNQIYTGISGNGVKDGLKFLVSGGEVRPKNMAIKIWKRV